jgi:hypothetical protein
MSNYSAPTRNPPKGGSCRQATCTVGNLTEKTNGNCISYDQVMRPGGRQLDGSLNMLLPANNSQIIAICGFNTSQTQKVTHYATTYGAWMRPNQNSKACRAMTRPDGYHCPNHGSQMMCPRLVSVSPEPGQQRFGLTPGFAWHPG